MSTTTPNYHHLTVTISALGDLDWSITCTAPEGAPCRMWCDEGCEAVLPEHEGHALRDQGMCGLTPWFEDFASIPELYDGPDQPLRSGPVILGVSDEQATWEYAEVIR